MAIWKVSFAAVVVGLTMAVECGVVAADMFYSSKLVHRFSDEVKKLRVSRNGEVWPQHRSLEYYGRLMSSDLQRQKMKLGPQFQLLFPSEGSKTMPLGNDFGWLHYMYIDIGTPTVSFLVALDAGSDLLWVPCECVQCAPLSASYYSSLDKDLNEYNPSGSSTSKFLSCSHQLCELGSNCKNPKQPCPYTVNYVSDDTSTSGVLVEDILHLASGSRMTANSSARAPVIFGCGSKQTGGYLNGVAPDGLLGLGPGEISVPSRLAKAGFVRNCFSLCFKEDDSGRIFFGDQGPATQQITSFLPSDGQFVTYLVGVESCCVGSSCIEQTNFKAIVDSGTSFTFLPDQIYDRVVKEFDREVNATKASFEGYPWQYCYKSSSEGLPKIPSFTLKFMTNSTFIVQDPVFVIYGSQGAVGFCLAVEPSGIDIGTIGQNFMTGYRMVFDRENLKLGWSLSDCQDLTDSNRLPMTPANGSSPNSLPTDQQNSPNSSGVAPAVAGRTPSKSAAPTNRRISFKLCLTKLLFPLLLVSSNFRQSMYTLTL
ncbi:aspartic proteinase-like protein 1 isoform X2 [Nicotiana tabacum]|uniref:Aspartic proteinase-like protein 1 isoform X2 n=2 Tax=Nicotiana TaxID=4085 RepID=A0AC58S866_TOBAC|nr:PREDICTED: aspartic proteinase-like protein 1 isoform X2 [Nicotiana sylvestris]